MTISFPHKSEQYIRAWSFYNETVQKYVRQADEIRLQYLEKLGGELGMAKKQSRYFALTEYAMLIGIQQLSPEMNEEQKTEIMKIVNLKIN